MAILTRIDKGTDKFLTFLEYLDSPKVKKAIFIFLLFLTLVFFKTVFN
jgi:hypothetical protein